MTIGANDFGEGLACAQALGQTILFDPRAIALRPVRSVLSAQPLGELCGNLGYDGLKEAAYRGG